MGSTFRETLDAVASRPYRKLVAERISGGDPADLARVLEEARGRMPERLGNAVPGYLKAARDKFLESKLFWEASTCREALANILELAAETVEDQDVWECHKRPFDDGGELAGRFFELSTAFFAVEAATSPAQAKLMGIRKGWLR